MEKEDISSPEKYQRPNQFCRAWKLTSKIFGNIWALLIFALIVFVVGSGIFFLWKGLEETMGEIPAALSWGFLAQPVAFVLLYLINLVRAPYVINKEQVEIIRNLENELSPERISARISYEAHEYWNDDGTHYAAIEFINENPQTVKLKGLPKGIFHDSDGFNKNLVKEINRYEAKNSWRGGSTTGTEMIEHRFPKSLHIAFIENQKLNWVFQKGDPKETKGGIYKVKLTVMGNLGERMIEEIQFAGRLEYSGGDELKFREWVGDEKTGQEIKPSSD